MKKMINNYESRMKKFVLKMAQTPIIIKKSEDIYSTTREEFLAKTSNNILDKKGFTFKSYKTDRERINKMIEDKNESDKYIPKTTRIRRKIKDWGENKLVQPSMRFTARCDLERVFDVLKGREFLDTEQKLLNNQMKNMGFDSQNVDEYDDESNSNLNTSRDFNLENHLINENKFLSQEEKMKKMRHNKIIQDRKMMIARRNIYLGNNKKNKNDSEENNNNDINTNGLHYAKHLRGELNRKTHFKAMENLTMFKTSTMNHNLFKKWSNDDKKFQKKLQKDKILFYQSISKKFRNMLKESRDKINKKYHISLSHKEFNNNPKIIEVKSENEFDENELGLGQNRRIFKDMEINKELMVSNPLLYNLNFNSLKSEDKTYDELSKKKIKALKQLAFEKNTSKESSFVEYDNYGGDDLKREENIIIDGKYYKKSDTNLIADKLLSKCNWNEKRAKYKKQSGSGKLMFTNGLTLKEFETKYGIFP